MPPVFGLRFHLLRLSALVVIASAAVEGAVHTFPLSLRTIHLVITLPVGVPRGGVKYEVDKFLYRVDKQAGLSNMPIEYNIARPVAGTKTQKLFQLCLTDMPNPNLSENRTMKRNADDLAWLFTIKYEPSAPCKALLTSTSTDGFVRGLRRFSREVYLGKATGFRLPIRVTRYSEASARWGTRGHQYSMTHHPSMFRTWSEFESYSHDLQVFGTNTIEGAHIQEATTESTVATRLGRLPVSSLVEFSSSLSRLNMSVSFWWPDTLSNMSDLSELREIFSKSPRIDSLFFPGGDGGTLDWHVIGTTAKILRLYHPEAGVWVSAQEVDAATFTAFANEINTNTTVQKILNLQRGGVVYGPHNRLPFLDFTKRFRSNVRIRQYPDLCHTFDAQYALKNWDAQFAFSYGRQVVNPSPIFMSQIVKLRSNGSTPSVGVGAYSEGLNDDLNKFVWSAMGEDASLTIRQVVRQYASYFFSADTVEEITSGLFGLENNWVGYARSNKGILETLKNFQQAVLRLGVAELDKNWRLQMYLRRALMDAYVQRRVQLNLIKENAAYAILQGAINRKGDVDECMTKALFILEKNVVDTDQELVEWNKTIVDLTINKLNATIGNEVLQSQDYFLNLQSFYTETSDCGYLVMRLKKGKKLKTVNAKITLLKALLRHRIVPNAAPTIHPDRQRAYYYDFLGGISQTEDHPHLMIGSESWDISDPSSYFNPLQMGFQLNPEYPRSWSRYAMSFYDQPLRMKYTGLKKSALYQLTIVYFADGKGETGQQTRLRANGVLLHDYQNPPFPMAEQDFMVNGTSMIGGDGSMIVSCDRRPGLGGNGMTCKICEITLIEV